MSENTSLHNETGRWKETILPILLIILAASPVLFIPYLPMTDFPQHLATLSILTNIDDPSFGFSQYYELDFTKSLYILPYLLAWGLTVIMPIELALRSVVFLSIIVYPLGLLLLLRSRRKPAMLALLAVPLIYNIATFWGLFNYNLAMGASFFAFHLFSKDNRTLGFDIILTVLCLLLTTTHLYGSAIILGYALLWGLFGEGKNTVRRYLPLAPCALGIALWVSMWKSGMSIGQLVWTPFTEKIFKIENAVLGGYKDWSETWILSGFGFIILLFFVYGLWINRKNLTLILNPDRVFIVYIVANFIAYLLLPLHIPSATFIHPRHVLLVFCLLPLVVPVDFLKKLPILGNALLLCLALASIGNSWKHLADFNRESSPFDAVIDKVPMNQKILQLTLEPYGHIMKSAPYLHYLTYIQAKKGGIVATGFAQYIWIAPIKMRDDVAIPRTPDGYEWFPELFNYESFGYYYNYLLVRGYHPAASAAIKALPYKMIYNNRPWTLYRSTTEP